MVLEAREKFGNPTVVVVVDRTELEGQLAGWVERLLGEMQQQDIAVWRAGSKDQLRELLATDRRGLIISMIHKFDGIEKDANPRDNIYVFIDEAHRSVARELGTYLMAALPNSRPSLASPARPSHERSTGRAPSRYSGPTTNRAT